jgi:methionine-rich copper-binding protein CopC
MIKGLVKFSLIMSLLLITFLSPAQPLNRTSPEDRATNQTARLKKELKLSAEQENKIYSINLKYAKRNQDLAGKRRMDAANELSQNLDMKDEEMKTVLNEEQYKRYLEIEKNRRENLKKRFSR